MLILDFDLHHGNGTADIFADDPSVLFIDTHEASSTYPPPFAPGGAEDVGEGAGRGATINVPLPRERCRARVARAACCAVPCSGSVLQKVEGGRPACAEMEVSRFGVRPAPLAPDHYKS